MKCARNVQMRRMETILVQQLLAYHVLPIVYAKKLCMLMLSATNCPLVLATLGITVALLMESHVRPVLRIPEVSVQLLVNVAS